MLNFAVCVIVATLSTDSIPTDSGEVDSVRHQYVREYPDHFFVWPVLKQRSISFVISGRNTRTSSLTYRPNNSFNAGIGLYIFDVVVELTASIPLNERSITRFGESDTRDLQANILGKHWGVDLFRQQYSGFYLTDSESPVSNGLPFPQRPDIDVLNWGVSGMYVLDRKKFSIRSAYNFAERQLKTKGSWVITGTINNFKMEADASVLTPAFEQSIPNVSAFQKLKYTTLSVAPGYSQNIIYKQFFLNATLSLGPGHHWVYSQRTDGTSVYDVTVNSFAHLRLGLGYNSDRVFGGISFVSQSRSVKFDELQFTNSSGTFKMLVGLRFRERGVLKKRVFDLLPL